MTYWHCVCDCGEECDKSSQELRRVGEYQSCGKCQPYKIRSDTEDLTNKRFGRLRVIGIDEEKRNEIFIKTGKTRIYWKCLCDCGNYITSRGDALKEGRTVSCGCYNNEILKNVVPKKNWKTNDVIKLDDSILIKSSNTDDYFRIDIEDYEKVKNYCWCSSHGYAVAPIRGEKNKYVRMHRIIMNCDENDDNFVVDHINHDTFDNRKSNLRIATDLQNNWNSINAHNSGIKYNANTNKWNVYITYNLQKINLGLFSTYDEAQDVRLKAEEVFYKEYKYSGGET